MFSSLPRYSEVCLWWLGTLKCVVRCICLESYLFPLAVCVFVCVCAIAWLLDVNNILWFTQCYLEHFILLFSFLEMGFPCGSAGKESACNAGDLGSIPGLGRSSGEGKGYPLQYSGLENPRDYSPWGRKESDTTEQLSLFTHLFEIGD